VIGPLHAEHDELFGERGAGGLPELELIGVSPWLNMYVYPRDLDYPRATPLVGRWLELESCVRAPEAGWDGRGDSRPLVYLSLGSLGSADVELMQGLIDALASVPHRVVVSLGPQHDQLTLAGNMTGAEFLPQVSILPQVDAVITHGGNNTVTECLHFGKPMVVLPIFWDQHDNAQRVQESGLGLRLDTYCHAPDELTGALDDLLSNEERRRRLDVMSARLRRRHGTERAAELIEACASR
jgi:MGT family glycosyltransferase